MLRVVRDGVSRSLCPLWVLRSRVLEQDQEPGWLAGRQRQSASPAECRDLALAQLGRLLFFFFFPRPGQLIPSIFNELPQVAQ